MEDANQHSIEVSQVENDGAKNNEATKSKTPQAPQHPPHKPLNPRVSKTTNSRKRSWVWDHFTELEGEKDRASCNYCDMSYGCASRNGTSSMATHLQSRCKIYPFRKQLKGQTTLGLQGHLENKCNKYPFRKQVKGQTTLAFQPCEEGNGQTKLGFQPSKGVTNGNLVPTASSMDACRKALAEMVILDGLPSDFVENEGFKRFMHVVCPEWLGLLPSSDTVERDCRSLLEEERSKSRNLNRSEC